MGSNSVMPFHNEGHDTYPSGRSHLFRISRVGGLPRNPGFSHANIGHGP